MDKNCNFNKPFFANPKNIIAIKTKIEKLRPSVNKPVLVATSGLVWLCTGIMLFSIAIGWINNSTLSYRLWFPLIGIIAGVIIDRFGFSRIVAKNLNRIEQIEGKHCAFGFMPLKSYLMIAVMMTLGIILKHSALPKEYLSIIYFGIGLALTLSSIRYFKNLKKNQTPN